MPKNPGDKGVIRYWQKRVDEAVGLIEMLLKAGQKARAQNVFAVLMTWRAKWYDDLKGPDIIVLGGSFARGFKPAANLEGIKRVAEAKLTYIDVRIKEVNKLFKKYE